MKNIIMVNTLNFFLNADLQQIHDSSEEKMRLFCIMMKDKKVPEKNISAFEKIIHVDKSPDEKILGTLMLDEDASDQAIQSIYEEYNLEPESTYIITLNELSMEFTAKMRRKYNAKGGIPLEQIEIFRDKCLMKKILHANNVRAPKYSSFDWEKCDMSAANSDKNCGYFNDLKESIGLPFIIKPTKGAGAVDVAKIYDESDFLSWLEKYHSRQHGTKSYSDFDFQVEEFIAGTLFHVDSILKDGELIWIGMCEYIFPCFEFLQGKSLGSFLMRESNPLFGALSKFHQDCLKAFGNLNGIYHMEVFLQNKDPSKPEKSLEDRLVFLEVGCRSAGADVPLLYENAFGISLNLFDFFIQTDTPRAALKAEIQRLQESTSPKYITWVYMAKKPGVVEEIIQPEDLIISSGNYKGQLVKKEWKVKVGDVCDYAKSVIDYAACFQFSTDDYEEGEKLFRDFHELDLILFKNE